MIYASQFSELVKQVKSVPNTQSNMVLQWNVQSINLIDSLTKNINKKEKTLMTGRREFEVNSPKKDKVRDIS